MTGVEDFLKKFDMQQQQKAVACQDAEEEEDIYDEDVIDSYDLVETDTELYLTEQVNNIVFEKN